jgi:cellulose synthase/poly-beta-1,6-N-acetylglucosamine synthase-like glycosyltransferase
VLIAGCAIICCVLILALAGGYLAWLLGASTPAACPASRRTASVPDLLVIVPVLDEAPIIDAKLENLSRLRYPAERLRILLVDGGSTDGTRERIAATIAGRSGWHLLPTSARNKTAQLNAALRERAPADWTLITDADALLPSDALERLVSAAAADERWGAMGVLVTPSAAHPLEQLHWRLSDALRRREAQRGSAAIVTAPCYLVGPGIVDQFPDDTVADDVHVACRAMMAGRRVGLVAVRAVELRSPRTLFALVRHKLRKADAYLREIVRFLPVAGRMPPPMRTVFLWRAALISVMPWLCASATLSLVFCITRVGATAAAIAVATLAAMLLIRPARQGARVAGLAMVLAFVSALALLRYPVSRQTAALPKILSASEYRLSQEAE